MGCGHSSLSRWWRGHKQNLWSLPPSIHALIDQWESFVQVQRPVLTCCLFVVEISCQDPVVKPHSKIVWDGSSRIGSVVYYQCEEGFHTRSLKNYSVCGENGLWEDIDLWCEGAMTDDWYILWRYYTEMTLIYFILILRQYGNYRFRLLTVSELANSCKKKDYKE